MGPPRYRRDGSEVPACPVGGLDLELAHEALELWTWARRGFLPRPGGWRDQAERDLMMLETVWGAFDEWRIRCAS